MRDTTKPRPKCIEATLDDYIVIDGLMFRIQPEGRGYRLIHVPGPIISPGGSINRIDR